MHPRASSSRVALLLLATLPILPAQDPKFTLVATSDNFQLGSGFTALGDLDGDGTVDLALADQACRISGRLGSGIVHVISGADGSVIRSHVGTPASSQYFGLALAALDADGDGILDLAVGAPGQSGASGFGAGAVWIYSGADGSVLSQAIGPPASQYGSSLANAGDFNADGIDDLLVGAPNTFWGAGAVFIQSGADGSMIGSIASDSPFVAFGATLASLDDADGDGLREIAIGAPSYRDASSEVGRISLFHGPGEAAYASISGSGFFNRLGQSMAPVADHDGDGAADLLIGSFSGGTLRVVSGRNLATLADLSFSGFPAFRAIQAGGCLDYDRDGIQDWLIGSTGFGLGGIRILSGADHSILFATEALEAFTGLGASVRALPGFGFAAGAIYQHDDLSGGMGLASFWEVEFAVADTDGDGVPDDADLVPNSITDPTVLLFGGDSGVENRVDSDGITLADRIAELPGPDELGNQGRYVSSLNALLSELGDSGLISKAEADALRITAVQSLAHSDKKAR